MKTRQSGMPFALVGALLLFGFATSTVRAGNLVEAGKIKLIGLVKSVNPQKHTLILSAAGYADENSQNWTVFDKARPKTVIVPSKACYIYAQGITQGQVSSGRLRAGMPVIVSASAAGAGVGQPVTAETVGLFVKGTAFDLAAYHNQLSGTGQNPPDGSDVQQGNAASSGFNLAGLIDKAGSDITAYEAVLGQPIDVPSKSNGVGYIYRVYKGPVSGLKEVILHEQFTTAPPHLKGEVPTVPWFLDIKCDFLSKGHITTWQSALSFLGFSLDGVKEGGNNGKDTEDLSLEGLPGFKDLSWTPPNTEGTVTKSGDEYTLELVKYFR